MTDQRFFTPEQAVEVIKKLAESGEIKLMQFVGDHKNNLALADSFNDAAYFNAMYLKALFTEMTQPCDEDTFFDKVLAEIHDRGCGQEPSPEK